jgi:hypothetical protein
MLLSIIIVVSVILGRMTLGYTYAVCRKQVHYSECRYAECRYAECRDAQ